GVICVAGIVQLRAIADNGEHVHLCTHFDVFAGPGHTVLKCQTAFGCDGDVHEEVDVVCNVPLLETASPTKGCLYKALAARVHEKFLDCIPHHVAFGRACAAKRVVAPAGVG